MRTRFVAVTTVASLLLSASVLAAATVAVPGDFPTIQAALDHAADGSVIGIARGRYHERLVLTRVTRTLTVRGVAGNPAAVVVDGDGGPDAVLSLISARGDLVFEDLTFTGGRGHQGYGGGLFIAASAPTFRRCIVSGNSADPDGGGAFFLDGGGLFEDCTFQDNAAARFGGGVHLIRSSPVFRRCTFSRNDSGTRDFVNGWGGGLYVNDSSPALLGCTVQNNRARFAAGGISIMGHYDAAGSFVTIQDTTITGNVATPASGTGESNGGGIHIEDKARAVLERVRVADNVASSGGGVSAYRARYEIVDSVIENNRGDAVIPDQLGGFGGGVWIQSVNVVQPVRPPASLLLVRSVVRGNRAHVGAGVFVQGDFMGLSNNQSTLDVDGTLIAANVATGRGGGIVVDRTLATVRRSQVLSNQAVPWGGGVMSLNGSVTTIDDTTIAGNAATDIGGGIFAGLGGRLDVTGSRFYGNTASGSVGLGGGALGVSDQTGLVPGPVTGRVENSVLVGNGSNYEVWEASCGLWSTIVYRNNTIHPGGGVYFRNCTGGTATVAGFNAIAGKASGNVDQPASFASFLAAPTFLSPGGAGVLGWCVPGGSGLQIDGGVGAAPGAIGTANVAPAVDTTYTLSSGAGALATATIAVGCPGLEVPAQRSPRNDQHDVAPGNATLAWHPATGATSYDVYLDTTDPPGALLAGDVIGTSVVAPGLPPSTPYFWRVVAKSPGCAHPASSPVFTFTTCGNASCEFLEPFDDADISDWTRTGKGTATVVDGALRATTRRKLRLMPPAPSMQDGALGVTLTLVDGKRSLRVLFGYLDGRNYRELLIQGPAGRWKLRERANGRTRRRASGAHAMALGGPMRLRLEVSGLTASVFMDGAPVVSGQFSRPNEGHFGLEVLGSTLLLDDLSIAGE